MRVVEPELVGSTPNPGVKVSTPLDTGSMGTRRGEDHVVPSEEVESGAVDLEAAAPLPHTASLHAPPEPPLPTSHPNNVRTPPGRQAMG